MPASLRPVLTLTVGLMIGFLVAWGFLQRVTTKSASEVILPAPVSTPATPQVIVTAPEKPGYTNIVSPNPPAIASARPSPTPLPNGLPLGVTPDALNYNQQLYQKYPGLQPPLIKTDGKDIGPEARQRLQASPALLANPEPSPTASVSRFPWAFSDRAADRGASPSLVL